MYAEHILINAEGVVFLAGADLVQSLTRGLELLELIAGADEGLSLGHLAGELGVKPPTAHNLLRTLMARGYVEKTERPVRYRLGPALPQLVAQRSRRAWVDRAAETVARLYAALGGATVTVAEYGGGEVSLVLRMSPETGGTLERPAGRHMHAYGSASSLVFQAFLCTEDRQQFRQRYPFWEFGAQLWKTSEAFELELERIRRQGYASPPPGGAGTFLAAAPAFDEDGHIMASVGVSWRADAQDVDKQACLSGVLRAAAELSAPADHSKSTVHGGRQQ